MENRGVHPKQSQRGSRRLHVSKLVLRLDIPPVEMQKGSTPRRTLHVFRLEQRGDVRGGSNVQGMKNAVLFFLTKNVTPSLGVTPDAVSD